MRLPLAGGMVFRTSGTWPRTTALYCFPVSCDEWPADPDIVERVRLRSCVRRGAAIDLVLDRIKRATAVRPAAARGAAAAAKSAA